MNTTAYIVCALLLLTHCTNPSKLISWKDADEYRTDLNKILVISIVHDSLAEVKKEVEAFYADALKSRGYNTTVYSDAFDNKSLARLAQEQTYISLCDQGIDAVLTIALLNEKKASRYHDKDSKKYSSSYYFNRLLNYRSMRANPKDITKNERNQGAYLWEVTLFKLSTLSPIYWAQTKSFSPDVVNEQHVTYSKIILNHLSKKKVLK